MEKADYEIKKEITRNWGFDKKIIQSGLYKIEEFRGGMVPRHKLWGSLLEYSRP